MKCGIFAAILLGLCVVACCGPVELPAVNYIDTANVVEDHEEIQTFIRDFVEKHGGENYEDTDKLLRKLTENLEEWTFFDKIKDRDILIQANVGRNGIWTVMNIIYMFSMDKIVHDPENNSARFELDLFLGTIKRFFGDNLEGFASGKVTHDTKLHAYLLHYSKAIVSHWLSRSVQVEKRDSLVERFMAIVVAHNMEPGYNEAGFISKAQTIDLAKDEFNAASMESKLDQLQSANKELRLFESGKRLSSKLKAICRSFAEIYGRDMEVYTWARLLIPEEVTKVKHAAEDLPRLAEYWRICLPVINPKTYPEVVANVKRNSSLGKRIKKILS